MNKKVTGILSYCTVVGWLIAYLAGDKEGAKFHLNQGLVLAIAEVALMISSTVFGLIPLVGDILNLVVSLAGIVVLVLQILGIIAAAKDEEKALPLIGNIILLK